MKQRANLLGRFNIEDNRYTRWERAETEPDISNILRICQVLNVDQRASTFAHRQKAQAQIAYPDTSSTMRQQGSRGPDPRTRAGLDRLTMALARRGG